MGFMFLPATRSLYWTIIWLALVKVKKICLLRRIILFFNVECFNNYIDLSMDELKAGLVIRNLEVEVLQGQTEQEEEMNALSLTLTNLIFIKNIYAFLFKTGIIGSTIIFMIYVK
jgi:hypothetical protein